MGKGDPGVGREGRVNLLLWTDSSAAYLDAIKAAGLGERVAVDTLPRKEKPSADQLARTEALMAYVVPPGLLPAMPKLRWAQVMTAGVEEWLALPDLPPRLTLTCARGTHAESMPENIIGALLYVAKPYAAAVANQKRGTWVRTVAPPLTGQIVANGFRLPDISGMSRRFDHIDLRVPDLGTVNEFYRSLLPALGFEEEMPIAGWLQYCARGESATEFFGVTESPLHASNENRTRSGHPTPLKSTRSPGCSIRSVQKTSRGPPAKDRQTTMRCSSRTPPATGSRSVTASKTDRPAILIETICHDLRYS